MEKGSNGEWGEIFRYRIAGNFRRCKFSQKFTSSKFCSSYFCEISNGHEKCENSHHAKICYTVTEWRLILCIYIDTVKFLNLKNNFQWNVFVLGSSQRLKRCIENYEVEKCNCVYMSSGSTMYMGTVRPKSRQGNTTNLNISFSTENEKRAAQVGLEPTTYCLRGRCSTN